MLATASAPSTRNSSRSGAVNASRVSAVTDAASRSTSIDDASTPSTSATAASTSMRRSRAEATTLPRFCHGSPATTSSTRSRSRAQRVSTATTMCAMCTGSNVPPRTPSRSTPGSVRVHPVFTTPKHSRHLRPYHRGVSSLHVLVRVWLPDRPGALGLVASRIGSVDGDIVGIDVLEQGDGVAVDEFAVELRDPNAVTDPRARDRGGRRRQRRTGARRSSTSPTPASTRSSRRRASVCVAVGDEAAGDARRRDPGRIPRRLDRAPHRRRRPRVERRAHPRSVRARSARQRHRGIAARRGRHHRARRPRGRVARRARSRDCSSGRDGHPFRRRERAQLLALAGIADRAWTMLEG